MGMTGTLFAYAAPDFLTAYDDVDNDPTELESFVEELDVDKMWNALSVLTTPGSGPYAPEDPHPLDPLLGGTAFGPDDGLTLTYFDPDQVKDISAHLAALTDDAAKARFDPDVFASIGVYPTIWDEDPDELWDNDLQPNLMVLRAFYRHAATGGLHVVVAIG